MLKFRLTRATRLVFTVVQVAPVCRTVGFFSVAGHRGVNRVRFNGRLHKQPLQPGTYQILARTLDSRMTRKLVIVLVDSGSPSPAALASARQSDVCSPLENESIGSGELAANVTGVGGTESAEVVRTAPKSMSLGSFPHPSALGSQNLSTSVTSPLALALFGVAILLLGFASLPRAAVPDGRLSWVSRPHRGEIALAGLAALGAAVAVLLLTS